MPGHRPSAEFDEDDPVLKPPNATFLLYIGRVFLARLALFLIFFTVILQMLDLLNNSSDILAVDGAGFQSILRYLQLRMPQIISQFTPFAALLAIVTTLAGLSHTSEITIMRAAGMSIHRVLFPFGAICGVVAFTHFVFHETIVVPSTDELEFWEANEFRTNFDRNVERRTDIWIPIDANFVHIGTAIRTDDLVTLTDLKIYAFDENAATRHITFAQTASYKGGQWTLDRGEVVARAGLSVTPFTAKIWETSLNPDLLFALSQKEDRTSLPKLVEKIAQQNAARTDTRETVSSFLGRFSRPLSTLVMPLLGAIAGFGVHRQGALLIRAVTGAALGFTYFVSENLLLALGKLGAVPAFIGAFFPFAVFMVIGFAILLAMENQH